ncbi:hypothetical protein ACFVVX_26850 [Kitasatospora sp. NPDC058170]|uniref:hypothetical protein n=1 Tax=Kitasatospora sp. NPDC058170 TaxID=3346364 RepID=UPI0036DB621B
MSETAGDGADAAYALGNFLRTRAQEAGLSARGIARAFEVRADREQAQIAAGAGGSAVPVSGMNFSKSHLDRLFKGGTALPSGRFLGVFLEITSAAAGLPPQRHQALIREATELLTKARRLRTRPTALPQPHPEPPTTAAAIATLQAQLDLERAHRTGDRLRRELSDTQALMGTLLQIIDALRDIITELDLDLVGAPRTAGRTVPRSLAERQRTDAVEYKAAAETEFDRVDHRRRCWSCCGTRHRATCGGWPHTPTSGTCGRCPTLRRYRPGASPQASTPSPRSRTSRPPSAGYRSTTTPRSRKSTSCNTHSQTTRRWPPTTNWRSWWPPLA